jgi:hypothetical protein
MISVDPNGEFVFLIPVAIGLISGYIGGRAAGLKGGELAAYTIGSGIIGAITGGFGSAIASATSTSLGTIGSIIAGGTVAGSIGGAFSNGLAQSFGISQDGFLEGAWKGAAVGLVSAGVGGTLVSGGYNGWGAFLGGAAGNATGAALNNGNVLQAAAIGGAVSYGLYQATTPKGFKSLSASARKEIRLRAEWNKKNGYNKESLSLLNDKGDNVLYMEGLIDQVPPENQPKMIKRFHEVVRGNEIEYDIHTHTNDRGLSGYDADIFLRHGEHWGNPNVKLISVGPSKVDMLSGWTSDWAEYPTGTYLRQHKSSWELHLHTHVTIFWR